jgi:thiamine biosynthesis lipoprotein
MSPDTFRSMGVEVAVGGASPSELARVQSLFDELDTTFTRFRKTSELCRVNAAAGSQVLVSPRFSQVVRLALRAAAATNGRVDPTLGRALEAAGYDRDFDLLEPRSTAAGMPSPGCWRDVRLCGRMLSFPPGVALDLNGVVKGLAADEGLRLLAGDGFVSAGGDVAARGRITVAVPGGDTIVLRAGGIATSGSTRRRWRNRDTAAHHLLDPATGRTASSPWAEVTVVAGSCLAADVAAKAAFLAGADGPAWLDRHGLGGRFVGTSGTVVDNAVWKRATAQEQAA